jgi:tetratricopeptide (TPR) repeat protein
MPGGTALSAERPFPGLRPYGFADHPFFFGRDDQIYSLYRILDRSRFIAVVGSSGSGKSSLVRAGLLPLIEKESQESGGRSWRWAEMRPGNAPLAQLTEALLRLSPNDDNSVVAADRRERVAFALGLSSFGLTDALGEIESLADKSILLVVDQFEELFRYVGASDARAQALWREEVAKFVQLLLEVGRSRERPVHVLITMRSDFIGDSGRFHGLPEAVSATQFLVPSLTRDQCEEVIRRPIEHACGTIEPVLVERLLNDSGDELDELPVLQHCLMRLWERAGREVPGAAADISESGRIDGAASKSNPGRHLGLGHYRAIGTINRALSMHADEILKELPGLDLAVEQVFRAMSEVDKEGRAARRALAFSRLLAETGVPERDLRSVLTRFRADDCSFLVPAPSSVPVIQADTRIDVGHEALLRRWERVSAEPGTTPELLADASRIGWLRAEESDGQRYRGLLALVGTEDRGAGTTLPLDQVDRLWQWWSSRPRTPAWAERYGGHVDRVERLFQDSLAALQVERDRQEAIQKAAAQVAQFRRQRRILAATAGGLVIALLLAGTAVWQWRIAMQQRELAQERQQQAQQQYALAEQERARAQEALKVATLAANTLVFDLAQELRNRSGVPIDLVRKILDRAQELQKQLMQSGDTTPELMYSQAAALGELVTTLMAQGDLNAARKAAEQSRAILVALVAANPTDTRYERDLAVTYDRIGDVLIALGDRAQALSSYRSSLNIRLRLASANPDDPATRSDLATSYRKIGDILATQGDYAAAIGAYQQSLAIAQRLATADPSDSGWQRDLSTAYLKTGDVLTDQGRLDEALAAYRASLAIAERLAANDPNNTQVQRDLWANYLQIGDVLQMTGRYDDALRTYRMSVDIIQRLTKADPGNAQWQRDLSVTYTRLGTILLAKGSTEEGVTVLRESIAIAQRLAGSDPSNVAWQRDLSVSYGRLGDALLATGRRDEAIRSFRDSLGIAERLAARDPGNAQWQTDLVQALYRLGQAGDDRRSNFSRALEIMRKLAADGKLQEYQKRLIELIEQALAKL